MRIAPPLSIRCSAPTSMPPKSTSGPKTYVRSCCGAASGCARAATAALAQARHHVLDDGVVLERVDAEILAIAGLLEAAMGHLGDERDVVVDPHAAEAQRFGYAQRTSDIAGPHRGGQAVARRVGPGDRLLLV